MLASIKNGFADGRLPTGSHTGSYFNGGKMEANQREQIREGSLTRRVEEQTSKIPSINWLGLAVGSMVLSAAAEVFYRKKSRDLGTFFGLWAPSLMLIGVYNKIVKLEASVERNLLH